jgi:DnaJ-class molecular chaperone
VPAASGVGDLLVTVEIDVPKKLSDDERRTLEALADQMKGDALRDHLWELETRR